MKNDKILQILEIIIIITSLLQYLNDFKSKQIKILPYIIH